MNQEGRVKNIAKTEINNRKTLKKKKIQKSIKKQKKRLTSKRKGAILYKLSLRQGVQDSP